MDRRREYLNLVQPVCAECGEVIYAGQKDEAHHGAVHDKQGNRDNYPLFTNSLMCRVRLHSGCHAANPGHGRIPEAAPQLYENILHSFVELLTLGESPNLNLVRKEFEILRDEYNHGGR